MVSGSKKVFVIDTSLLLHDPRAILSLQDNIVVIPFPVLEELDEHKRRNENGTGAYARQASRIIKELGKDGLPYEGVPTPGGGVLIVDGAPYIPTKKGISLKLDSVDNFVIGVALKWQYQIATRHQKKLWNDHTKAISKRFVLGEVCIITKDINLGVKAQGCGVRAEDWESGKAAASLAELYTGIAEIKTTKISGDRLFRLFYSGGERNVVDADEVRELVELPELIPNQCCIFRDGDTDSVSLALFKEQWGANSAEGARPCFVAVKRINDYKGKGIKPRNYEQALAYALLTDVSMRIVTLTGIAGGGKTLFAVLAGLEQLGKTYDQMLIYRSNVEIGQPLGFGKGTYEQKFAPWAMPIFDTLELIANGADREPFETKNKNPLYDLDVYFKNQKILIQPINFIRGRSLHNKYVIIDETQNFRRGDVKKVLQRIGKGSKYVLTGDIEQVDDPFLDPLSNGLSHVVQHLKGASTVGHISFTRSERDELVNLVTERL